MRIAGDIPHPQFKITVFQYEGKYSVKIENTRYEQTFKIRPDLGVESVEDVISLIDPLFLEAAERGFTAMHDAMIQALARTASAESDSGVNDLFEEII